MKDKLYSIDQAALLLGGLSKWTVTSWLAQGRMKRTKIGRRTMIRESELNRFIKSCSQPKRKERGQ